MSSSGDHANGAGACRDCRRRSWLLGELSAVLDYHRGDAPRLAALLGLSDAELIEAVGGRRRAELGHAWESFAPGADDSGEETSCRHMGRWPARLLGAGDPAMLWQTGSAAGLQGLLAAPTVALLGSRKPSSYGRAVAGALARGLAAAGVTVVACLAEGIAGAAHEGAAAAGAGSLALAADGLGQIRPAAARDLARMIARRGCVLAELPARATGRGWGTAAALRSVAGLADLVLLVEARPSTEELTGVHLAALRGRPLGGVPGPVTSVLSQGPNALIRQGAGLVGEAGDVLELLFASRPEAPPAARRAVASALEPRLRSVLEQVGAGEDTPERLSRGARDPGAVIAALGELEAAGLLRRLPGGRYMPTIP